MTERNTREQKLKNDFIKPRGYWAPFWDGVPKLSSEYFETYMRLSSAPWKTGTLEAKVKEFVYIAVDALTTHLFLPGCGSISRTRCGTGQR